MHLSLLGGTRLMGRVTLMAVMFSEVAYTYLTEQDYVCVPVTSAGCPQNICQP